MPGPSAIAHATGRSFAEGLCALDEEAVMSVNIRDRDPDENFGPESVSRLYPAFCSARLRGNTGALRQLALLLRQRRPAGYGIRTNLVREEQRKDFSRASVNAELRHLGAGPLAWLRSV